jgi:uncharacterized membrane protein
MSTMKKFLACVVAFSLAGFTGCNPTNSGGKGTRETKLTVSGPEIPTTVKHGTEKTADIKVTRGKDLKEDVTLKAALAEGDEGKGVSVGIKPKTVAKSEPGEAQLTFKATEKASAGTYKVTVTAKPAQGDPASTVITFKVPEK